MTSVEDSDNHEIDVESLSHKEHCDATKSPIHAAEIECCPHSVNKADPNACLVG